MRGVASFYLVIIFYLLSFSHVGKGGEESRKKTILRFGADRFIPIRRGLEERIPGYQYPSHEIERGSVGASSNDYRELRQLHREFEEERVDKVKGDSRKRKSRGVFVPTAKRIKKYPLGELSHRINLRYVTKVENEKVSDDFYYKHMDWNNNNLLAHLLGPSVFIKDFTTGKHYPLCVMEEEGIFPTSVAWAPGSARDTQNILAIGFSHGAIEIWDVNEAKRINFIEDQFSERVGALNWRDENTLSAGSKSGVVKDFDIRNHQYKILTRIGHEEELCGLSWEGSNKDLLASGDNANLVLVWDRRRESSTVGELFRFAKHVAAVKALAWHPTDGKTLATGGGTSDRTIKFWNCQTGTHEADVKVNGQVSGLVWSPHDTSIMASSHGFEQKNIIVWKYPEMKHIQTLHDSEQRQLDMILAPDKSTVATIAGDNVIRLWQDVLPLSKGIYRSAPDPVKAEARLNTINSTYGTIR